MNKLGSLDPSGHRVAKGEAPGPLSPPIRETLLDDCRTLVVFISVVSHANNKYFLEIRQGSYVVSLHTMR